jgi:glycosyltransferase involved in cell wall biosynthesis
MKVVRIIARLNVGGPAVHVILLTHELAKRGFESVLLVGPVPETEGDMEYLASRWNVPLTHIAELIRPLSLKSDIVALWKIYKILLKEKPDIVETHTAKAGTLGRIAALMARVPVRIHMFHGNVFDGYFSPTKTRFFLFIERFLARFTDRIITVSKSQSNELVEKYGIGNQQKFKVVHLGIDLDSFRNRERHGDLCFEEHNGRALRIGWVGRFTEIKDPLFFVDAAAVLKGSGFNAKFVMVGDGHMRQVVEARIASQGLGACFTLTGWSNEMSAVYSQIDLIALTSVNEGTPITIIESMASGLAFVAFNVGGLSDLVTGNGQEMDGFQIFDNGILVSHREPKQFANALSILLQDPDRRRQMGEAGKRFVFRNFNKERLAEDMALLYKSLMPSSGCREAQQVPSG